MIERIEKALDAALPAADVRPVALSQALRWAVMGGGKRVRPQICLMAAQAAGGRAEDAIQAACAIEMLHSYTLVHDDLPAMDNDKERRGRPSVWAKFGEATAILAGDALQALAFRLAAQVPRNAADIVSVLGRAAVAVVEGQVEDLNGLNALNALNGLEEMFTKKTAALFAAAAEMGALAADAPADAVACLRTYGHALGMAFQYQDDLLDGEDGSFSSLRVLGRDEVRRRIAAYTANAAKALEDMPGDGDVSPLVEMAALLAARSF
jgi:geranylgeranyl pyrophosphate synthase